MTEDAIVGAQISLRLREDLLAELDRRARRAHASRSDMIREILEAHLLGDHAKRRDHPYTRVRDLVGSVSGGPSDLGGRHREHLVELVRDRRR